MRGFATRTEVEAILRALAVSSAWFGVSLQRRRGRLVVLLGLRLRLHGKDTPCDSKNGRVRNGRHSQLEMIAILQSELQSHHYFHLFLEVSDQRRHQV